MVVVSELWIGDLLRLKKSGRIGKFAGISQNQKVKVKIENKVILTTPGNLEHAPESISDTKQFIPRPTYSLQEPRLFSDSIDLHIEVLNPSMSHTRAERIIDYQINAAKAFIESSIKNKTHKIEIIHGKGQGVLKSEVLHLLSLFTEVKFVFETNNGGACEVLFNT